MTTHPLAEVFGFPTDNMSPEADRYRKLKLCPFNNRVPNCTKDKANDPLGVCSIYYEDEVVITCPVRFRQHWIIAEHAADFFFPPKSKWTSLTEVRIKDRHGDVAGNIDVVLVAYDERGRVVDFGALEVQAVYISGNIRRPFEYYMEDPPNRMYMDWRRRVNYPRPDYLSSSRKRLAPQLLYKGGIINAWKRKIAVAVNKGFFNTLPHLEEVSAVEADVAWMVYDLQREEDQGMYTMYHYRTIYSRFESSLNQITKPEDGDQQEFIEQLQAKLDEMLEDGNLPDTPTIDMLL
jgi:hypothetical protein